MAPTRRTGTQGALGLSGIETLEAATSDTILEEIQEAIPLSQTAITGQLRSVAETLAMMQQNQTLLMETLLALQKKTTTSPMSQVEADGSHPTASEIETCDN